MTTLRDHLRDQTAHLHGQAEIALDLMSPSLSLPGYLSVLELFHAFYLDLEPAILSYGGWAGLGLDMRARRKLPLLQADLASLGSRESARSSLPTFIDSFPAALGAAYVVEGSTLGGAIIHRHVARVLGFGAGPGASFFYCYGKETGSRWKQFVEALDRARLDPAETRSAVAGAVGTFEQLLSRLGRSVRTERLPAEQLISSLASSH